MLASIGDLPTGIISGTPLATLGKEQLHSDSQQPRGKHQHKADDLRCLRLTWLRRDWLTVTPARPCMWLGTAIALDSPIVSSLGGAPTNYSVFPDVGPIGLTLDPSSGKLSGVPAPLSSPSAPPLTATYTVTASNSAGTAPSRLP